jgi:hypothetical protein
MEAIMFVIVCSLVAALTFELRTRHDRIRDTTANAIERSSFRTDKQSI